MNIGMIIRNLFSRFLLILITIVFFIPIAIFICIPERYRYKYPFVFYPVHWFYVAILKGSLLPITYKGLENIPQDTAVIFAANHQSSLDIPLVGVLSKGVPHVWLAKAELMDSVFIRFIVPLISVLVDVTSPRNAMLSLRKILNIVNNHHRNLIIFPEGARYTDGKIHDFFGGFVILAKKVGRPVVPVCILGIDKAYPPETFWVQWYPITVIVGKPFIYEKDDSDESFKNRVHQWFIDQMRQGT
ncbi:MAG TPA: lysophospholipid acyltransferase family protein [Candidatus Babeliales bacterium]|jgi:1-acyl-sn-glycerol-3-phosphate acyltransferase|nr:lysophospholipid acyltransferase family protein [Candidatus Babeliales bacterium]